MSLRKIEAILGISRKTLSSWEPKLDEEIAKEQGRQLEHFNETYWATKKRRLGFLNERLNLLHEEESKRDLSDIPTAKEFSWNSRRASCSKKSSAVYPFRSRTKRLARPPQRV